MQCFRPGRKGSPEDRAVVRCPAAGPSEHFQGLLPAQPPAPLPPKPSPAPDTHSPVASPQKHLSFPLSRDALISWPLEMTFGFKAGRMRPKQGGLGELPWESGGPTNQRVDANSTLKARRAPLFCTLQGTRLSLGTMQ